MFEKFGEFDSAEEINRAAAAQLKEGDEEAIFAIAKENGIDKEDAEDFIDGMMDELTNPLVAAYGKLAVEKEDLKLEGVFLDWVDVITQMCTEDQKLCKAVRARGKRLEECMGAILRTSFERKVQVSERICKAAGLRKSGRTDPVYMGIPNRSEARDIIRKYYLGGTA